ncbi:MAG: CRISPR-associated protein Cas4 [Anaerolineae bacterium]|nr:CRISPR-associated protein Cas4 [Anaerolineae bacterium]MCX8067118.1 CRISPR-associated protein Cas4 [Anaerolineae bacterium]MDW7992364.1 CRISPR-associated protein Cas4 [Anaerolineae bacterium]
MTAVVLLLVLVGLVLLWLARRLRARTGLPSGRIVATDTGLWRRLDRPLFSHRYCLVGRPDYIVADGADLIPVEVKSARAPARPHASHILQLAAYCLLVAETSGRRPPYGVIQYADRTFRIPYTRELEEELLALLEEMREDLEAGDAPRRHQDPGRCRRCGYREVCEQSLV